MAYAKKQGKKLGRPATAQKKAKEVERLFYKKKMSKSAISKKLKIGYGSVQRIWKNRRKQTNQKRKNHTLLLLVQLAVFLIQFETN